MKTLLSTFSRYQDRPSRQAVQVCLESALRNQALKLRSFRLITDYVLLQSRRPFIANTDAFVLLEWSVLVQKQLSNDHTFAETILNDITAAASSNLEKCFRPHVKSGVQKSAVLLARRGLRAVLKSESVGRASLTQIIPSLITGPNATVQNIPYLGVIAGVCARIPSRKPELQARVKEILSFYAKAVIGSKHAVPTHTASGLYELFSSFVAVEDVFEIIIPPLEKAILRSPETVLTGLIPSFVHSLPANFDLSKALSSNLLQPLLSSLRSINAVIKEGAMDAFSALVSTCKDLNELSKIADDILSSLKSSKASTPELRSLLARLILEMPSLSETSCPIVPGLAPIVAKEANENALESEAAALCKHLTILLRTESRLEQSIYDTILKGCRDKRPAVRKAWSLATGEAVWELESTLTVDSPALDFLKAFSHEMIVAFEEACSNPLVSLQSGQASAAFMFVALVGSGKWDSKTNSSLRKDHILQQSLVVSPKPSFMLSSRVIARLSSPDEMIWVMRALTSIGSELTAESRETRSAWAQGLIYLLVAAEVPTAIHRATRDALTTHYLSYPMPVGESILFGLWGWLHALHHNEKESLAIASKTGNERLLTALSCVNVPKSRWVEENRQFPQPSSRRSLCSRSYSVEQT